MTFYGVNLVGRISEGSVTTTWRAPMAAEPNGAFKTMDETEAAKALEHHAKMMPTAEFELVRIEETTLWSQNPQPTPIQFVVEVVLRVKDEMEEPVHLCGVTTESGEEFGRRWWFANAVRFDLVEEVKVRITRLSTTTGFSSGASIEKLIWRYGKEVK